ncbi:uncharacterized protein LOC111379732 [Olea europaea var. sylvestris]|uniref:uncharacterized protein LOC111379732 n=1 Tax=Olea europaea var. sylvestris TaxID=158386 RepID=UPI000C1CF30C|nr:uncharacterized protein LOC111379732 [Olea europaea var. sylvestris]
MEKRSYQEPGEDDLFHSVAINLLANLHLDSSTATSCNHHPNTSTTAAGAPVSFTRKRSACGSMKRISQSSPLPCKETLWERANLHPSSSARAAATTTTKVPLFSSTNSIQPRAPSSNTLQSVPCKTTQILNPSSQFLNPQSTENSPPEATLPPLCSSDYQMVASATNMPPQHRQSSDQESPNSKRLKRMNERTKEMNQWCNQVIHEEEHKNEIKNEAEKAVWVDEINGGDLIIHFMCPCGGVYEILLSGNNCFYKL